MKISNYFLIAVGGAVIGAASGFAWRALDDAGQPEIQTPVQTVQQVDTLPNFSYPDLQGRQRSGEEFSDKVVVLNFWATWCPPCRKETPAFVALQERYGSEVQFIGIAIDDEEPVREFADSYGVNYPLLLGDVEAVALSRSLGNRYEGLPFTVVAAPGGNVVLRHTGGLERDKLEPLLQELTSAG
jgi:thiol-disulfide isomerase/thioredoxin